MVFSFRRSKSDSVLANRRRPAALKPAGGKLDRAAPSIYADEFLRALAVDTLIECMVLDEDCVPRNFIDECARRGDAMLDALEAVLESPVPWSDDSRKGERWLILHTIHILGLISGVRAGEMLLRAMMRVWQQDEGQMLIERLSGAWPALFRNKPDEVLERLRKVLGNRQLSPYLRSDLMEVLTAAARRTGAEALDAQLAAIAALAADETEHEDLRELALLLLFDFPRARHRTLLEDRVRRSHGQLTAPFTMADVAAAYRSKRDDPEWERFSDPWAFYAPDRIAQRQQVSGDRVAGVEDMQDLETLVNLGDLEDLNDLALAEQIELLERMPEEQKAPAVGRNDACPCGSGKKYVKCCQGVK